MRKIPSLFQRNFETDHLLRDEVTRGCDWVLNGEGVATRKWDGTAILIKDGSLFRRYDAKKGKTPPPDFIPAQDAPDPITLHWPGWIPALREKPENRWLYEAVDRQGELPDWTYELCGPKVGTNHEQLDQHVLIRHGSDLVSPGRTMHSIYTFLSDYDMEGIVFWRDLDDVDCEKAKIKTTDLGLTRVNLRAVTAG